MTCLIIPFFTKFCLHCGCFFQVISVKVIRYRHNTLIAKYYQNQQEFHKISLPLTPDIIVYCKTRYLFIEQSSTAEKILDSLKQQLPRFQNEYGYLPKIISNKECGIFAVENSVASAEAVLDVYEDLIKVSHYSSLCGGTKSLPLIRLHLLINGKLRTTGERLHRAPDRETD